MVPLSHGVRRPHDNNRATLPSKGDCHGNPTQRGGKCERKPQRYGAGILMATTLCGKKDKSVRSSPHRIGLSWPAFPVGCASSHTRDAR